MNLVHRRCCRSRLWRRHLAGLLPWATEGVSLAGARVLELGSGPGQSTDWLRDRVRSLTAVENDAPDATALARRLPDVEVVHGDATALPFGAGTFDVVVCFTMLHHVPTAELQDQLFAGARRVLRPGGTFAGSDSRWGPLFALAHLGDVLQLVDPDTLPARFTTAGFSDVAVSTRRSAFRFRATATAVPGN